jgi:hypothetical protein
MVVLWKIMLYNKVIYKTNILNLGEKHNETKRKHIT